jgi:hypothetical protein
MLQETQVLNQTRCKQARKKTQVFCLIDGFLLESLPIITSKSLVPRQKHEGNKKERVKNISGLLTEESAYRRSSSSLLLLPREREVNSDSASHTHVPGSQQTSWDSSNHTSKQQQKRKAVQNLAVEKKEAIQAPCQASQEKKKGS